MLLFSLLQVHLGVDSVESVLKADLGADQLVLQRRDAEGRGGRLQLLHQVFDLGLLRLDQRRLVALVSGQLGHRLIGSLHQVVALGDQVGLDVSLGGHVGHSLQGVLQADLGAAQLMLNAGDLGVVGGRLQLLQQALDLRLLRLDQRRLVLALVVVTELRDGLVGLLQQIVALGDQIGLGVADGTALDGD